MKDLMSILRDAAGSIKLEINGADLMEFSNELINRAKNELSAEIAEARMEVNSIDRRKTWNRGWGMQYTMGEIPFYAYEVFKKSKEEVKQICEVCDTTLWH